MNLLVNRSAKRLLILLVSVLFAGAVFTQITAYNNAGRFKNEMITHDYALAGYLSAKHPELASDIRAAFTADKTESGIEAGKALLEQAGYIKSINSNLLPGVKEFYRSNVTINLIYSLVMGAAVFLTVWLFLRALYNKLDEYNHNVIKIIEGEISTRLDDSEEGTLAKLAASVNTLTASLNTHIEREKHSRIFLKDVLTNVSHQLKTPLSALTMYTEIMRNENPDNEVIADFLDKSENELDRMQALIANLLKLARLDAGIIELSLKDYVLNDIIRQAAASFETRLLQEEKTLAVKADSEVHYACDREWLLEALSNLIKNAAEHTTRGNRIGVSLEETPVLVKITVRDNGEGIHPDDINHIFKRFYRSRFSQNKQGTGIGLTLAESVIEMHGGFISVESSGKTGTEFTVHLPRLTKL
ncbi:sensor histidine kinase [Phosphitispora fastidiosa]|uniref:sensor histidine kinase n=1 Tax=Phosphitispora fastidiosa TaxID=2837202 RepID=UPI001E550AB2|nr:HAMP domain-containing sensor histidine kinase [Phosphitispora fastidiosa]MBU7006040.1 signal transduction histidine kinase [Phosphitispora fastidiosa]